MSLEQAKTELRTITQRDQAAQEGGGDGGLTLVGLHEQVVGDVKGALLVLLGAVAFVLLIACANVANLLLARAAARQREMAVRAALGAGRWRVARAMLTESLMLSLVGGGVGLLLAFWGVRALGQLGGPGLPTLHTIGLDGWVLAFTFGVSVLTGLAFGVAPAVQAWRTDVNAALKGEGSGSFAGQRNRLRHLLLVAEVALALVLLVGAGLLLKSFSRLLDVDPGFRAEGVLTFQVTASAPRGPQRVNFIEQIVERLKALPGVESAAATDAMPLAHFARQTAADVEGHPPKDWGRMTREEIAASVISQVTVTADYFAVMGIPVKSGRAFTAQDVRPAAGTVVVNEAFANRHFPGEGAVGKRIRLGAGSEAPWRTVVGIVSDMRQTGLANAVMPEVYVPELAEAGGALCFVVRVTGAPATLAAAVRAVVTEVNPNQPLHNVTTLEQRLASTTISRRLNTTLLGGFAGLALLLAAVGIYGVMSYAVAQRRREIGVRLALGAQRGDVVGLIVGRGLRLALAGVAIGMAGALGLTLYLSAQLYAVEATDPATFASVAALLTAVALLACWLPARRAAKVDPMVALRSE